MRIGVTGAFGFVGTHLVEKLLTLNHTVSVLSHVKQDTSCWTKPVTIFQGTIEDKKTLNKFCENIDILYHLIGIIAETKTKTFSNTVANGTRNIMYVAKEQNLKKVIYLSAIGATHDSQSIYQQTKMIAEQAVMESQLSYVIFRPSILYGKGDGFITMLTKIIRISPFIPIIGSGTYKLQPLYIDDLVNMMTNVETIENEIIELGGPEKLEYLEILHILTKVLGKKRLNFYLPTMLMKVVASVLEKFLKPAPLTNDQIIMMESGSTCDLTKMKKLFKINPVSFQDGLNKYMR